MSYACFENTCVEQAGTCTALTSIALDLSIHHVLKCRECNYCTPNIVYNQARTHPSSCKSTRHSRIVIVATSLSFSNDETERQVVEYCRHIFTPLSLSTLFNSDIHHNTNTNTVHCEISGGRNCHVPRCLCFRSVSSDTFPKCGNTSSKTRPCNSISQASCLDSCHRLTHRNHCRRSIIWLLPPKLPTTTHHLVAFSIDVYMSSNRATNTKSRIANHTSFPFSIVALQ